MEAARPAVESDRATLEQLFGLATEELRQERGGVVWALETRRDDGLSWPDPGSGLVLAGTIDEAVVGYAVVRASALGGGGELAVISDVYVEPDARGVGVGEALLDACIAWARDRGCTGVDSVALPGMRASKNFFEAAGLVARAIVVHKALS
jgi:GNAT superfamily N-acetyltransferase